MPIHNLLAVPIADRDTAWEIEFLRELGRSTVAVVNADPVQGPDGWPYLLVATNGRMPEEFEPVLTVAGWLASRGMGMVVNPEKPMPDFVLPFGMIWNFVERGEFLTLAPSVRAGALEIQNGQKLLTGPPSRAFLPDMARSVLKEFFKRQQVADPRVLMISTDTAADTAAGASSSCQWDLAFSLESLGSPPVSEHGGIAEAIAWFLPTHYSVALVSEKAVPGFTSL